MLKLGVPVGNVHSSSLLRRLDAAVNHLFAVKQRLHSVVSGSRYAALCGGVADAFDAIVSKRPYKEPVSIPEALKEIERNLGTQFDPVIGRTFINLIENGTINTDFYN